MRQEGGMMHRTSFAPRILDRKKVTRRMKFLARMESVIPWGKLSAVIARHYPREGAGSRP